LKKAERIYQKEMDRRDQLDAIKCVNECSQSLSFTCNYKGQGLRVAYFGQKYFEFSEFEAEVELFRDKYNIIFQEPISRDIPLSIDRAGP
jgi:hypothetical protein